MFSNIRSNFLSPEIFDKAKSYIDDHINRTSGWKRFSSEPSKLTALPKFYSGGTNVYLQENLSIVFKKCRDHDSARLRFETTQRTLKLFKQHDYKNLTIPRSMLYENFIIAAYIPITMKGIVQQIALYMESPELFTKPVKEFTRLYLKEELIDILGEEQNNPFMNLSLTPIGRFDNVSLYIEKGIGKIGLVDSGIFKRGSTTQTTDWFSKCRALLCLFPQHLDDILDEVKEFDLNFDSNIVKCRNELNDTRDNALTFFKLIYNKHFDFIKKNEITFENPLDMRPINSVKNKENQEKMQGLILFELRKKIERIKGQGFLNNECENDLIDEGEITRSDFAGWVTKRSDEVLANFEKSFPEILDLTIDFCSKLLKEYNHFVTNLTKKAAIPAGLQSSNSQAVNVDEFVNSGFDFDSLDALLYPSLPSRSREEEAGLGSSLERPMPKFPAGIAAKKDNEDIKPISSYGQLLASRTVFYSINSPEYGDFVEQIIAKLNIRLQEDEKPVKLGYLFQSPQHKPLKPSQDKEICIKMVSKIIESIFETLEKEGMIAYFSQRLEGGKHCIFF